MLYKEIIAIYSENHKKHVSALCRQMQNLLLLNLVVHTVTSTNHYVLKV
jgi:hypothetical protein